MPCPHLISAAPARVPAAPLAPVTARARAPAIALALALGAVLALSPAGAGPAAAARTTPEAREQITLSFAPIVRSATPAVVNVFTRKVVRESPFGSMLDDPLFRQFFGGRSPFGVPRERVQNSLGSGVIVRGDGLVVTNAHVIADADDITVVLSDRREFAAKRLTVDTRTDLAVLRIDAGTERLPALVLGDSDRLEVGDLVLAIGNPFGVGQTVTSGIISALARTGVDVSDFNFFIQTDAAINPGNSGGALVAMDGTLIGINSAIYSRRGGGSIGIGFAIPANMVRSVTESIEHGGRVVRPWLGVHGQPVTAEIARSLSLARPAGVLVDDIDGRSPAQEAGLASGDIILTVNDQAVDDPESLKYRIATSRVGSEVTLTVLRRGQQRTVRFVLIAPPELPPRDVRRLGGNQPMAGAEIANLSPALADELGFDQAPVGVIVLSVAPRGQAQAVGLQAGDVVLRLNGWTPTSSRELERTLAAPRTPEWRLSIRRGDQVLNTTVRR